MIVFIDGFDLNLQATTSLHGTQDSNKYWSTHPQRTQYREGYLGGQSLFGMGPTISVRGGSYSSANSIPRSLRKIRVFVYTRLATAPGTFPGFWYGLLTIRRGPYNDELGSCLTVQCNVGNGTLRITRGGQNQYVNLPVHDDPVDPLTGGSLISQRLDELWRCLEFYVDYDTGEIELRLDGEIVHQTTSTIDYPQYTIDVDLTRPARDVLFDHFVVTEGERLAPSRTHAYAPTAAWDAYDHPLWGGCKGNLIVDGESHRLGGDNSMGSSTSHVFPDYYANVIHFLYAYNPATGLPWGSTVPEAWGVCTYGHTPPNFGYDRPSRLAGLGLSVVSTDGKGLPTIRLVPPSTLTYYSGNWQKTNPKLTLSGNLRDQPRTAAQRGLLMSHDDGCILFPVTETKPFWYVGLTFAQEYREDFRDWGSVDTPGYSFDSYFITGYSVLGEGNKDFQSNYVSVNYESLWQGSETAGGAFIQGVWDYAETGATGRWSSKQQVYNQREGLKHQIRRLKIRGRGKAMQIRVSSEEGKDFILNGWSVLVTGNTSP